jgi:predicted RNase H-like HicB family nuclease
MYHQIVLLPTADGGYTAEVPDIPGMSCYGETFDEALDAINEMIQNYLAACEADTQEIRRPSPTARV